MCISCFLTAQILECVKVGPKSTVFTTGYPNLSKLPHLQSRLICRLHVLIIKRRDYMLGS